MTDSFGFDTLGPLRGYRVWLVRDGRLTGPAQRYPWLPGEPLRAWCLRSSILDDRPIPHAGCTCGIYAMGSLAALGRGVGSVLRSPLQAVYGMLVLGEVRLWGRVFEHQLGWRAEWAYPVGLYRTWHPELEDEMQLLLHGYGIEPLATPEPIAPDAPALEPFTRFLSRTKWGDDPPGQAVPA